MGEGRKGWEKGERGREKGERGREKGERGREEGDKGWEMGEIISGSINGNVQLYSRTHIIYISIRILIKINLMLEYYFTRPHVYESPTFRKREFCSGA